MKDFMQGVVWAMLLIFVIGAGVREMLIHNGRLTSDLDAAGHTITNLPPGFHRDPEAYTRAETDARIQELAPRTSLEPATNYTDEAIRSLSEVYLPIEGGALSGGLEIGGNATVGADLSVSGDAYLKGANIDGGELRFRQYPGWDYVDTVITSNGVSAWRWLQGDGGGAWINYTFNWWELLKSESDPTVPAWAKASTKPTYTAEDVGAAPASHATNKSNPHNVTIQQIGAFSATDGASLAGVVNTWEGYWDGTNVVFEVTNYYGNSSGELPRLRIKEFRDGAWNIVWDEITKYEVCESNILCKVSESNRVLKIELKRDFAPIAWGTVTDKGSPNVVSNSVWMTSPETYFAGGTEYQRVAVGSGTICVLVDNGAGTYTAGEEGTFRFQDEGGTNYFGFAKSDSYTIGCKTDGISVEGTLVTLRYDVIMGGSDTPIVYYRKTLSAGEWVQLNNSDGTAASGAPYTVTWYTSGGSYYAAINCGENASGFFKAETSVAGDVVFETNMKARLGGGIECLNTANGTIGVIRPTFNGSTVSWSWSAK